MRDLHAEHTTWHPKVFSLFSTNTGQEAIRRMRSVDSLLDVDWVWLSNFSSLLRRMLSAKRSVRQHVGSEYPYRAIFRVADSTRQPQLLAFIYRTE